MLRHGGTMLEVIESHGHFAHGGQARMVAREWEHAGFSPEDTDAWLQARCFSTSVAHQLKASGLHPEQCEAVAYAASNGDMTISRAVTIAFGQDARRVIAESKVSAKRPRVI